MLKGLEQLQLRAETWSAGRLLRWASQEFGRGVEIASGVGAEGMVLIDLAAQVSPDLRLFTLDTGFLFPETYQLIETVERKYGIAVEYVRPRVSPEDQRKKYGPALWRSNPDQCCELRKVEPLREKLQGLNAWITAIRRDQTAARAKARKIEWDSKFQIIKINPIVDWTIDKVWAYIRKHDVPYNPLHDFNYPSIGCTHCTRAVHPGEDPRAGRWSGVAKTECGLHGPEIQAPQVPLVQLSPDASS